MASIADVFVTVLPETSKIASGLEKAFREVDPIARRAGERWREEIDRALSGKHDVQLTADTARAKADIDETARDRKATIEVDADTAKAKAEIDLAARDRKSTIEVDVDRNRLGNIAGDVIGGLEKIAPAIASSVAAAAPQVASEGAKLGQGLFSSIMDGAGGGEAGMVIKAVVIVSGAAVLTDLLGVVAELSGALALIPAGVTAIGLAFGVLKIGLDGISDAYSAVSAAAKSSGADQASHAQAVESATRSMTSAVREEKTAQDDVARARKDAARQLEDLNDTLRDGSISEARLRLELQDAQDKLATGTFSSSNAYMQQQLTVIDLQQQLNEKHKDNGRLVQDANDARAKGVEGNDKVIAAENRLASATSAAAAGQEALNKANADSSAAAKKADEATKNLGPNARNLIDTLQILEPVYRGFVRALQEPLLAGIGPQLQGAVNAILPVITPGLQGIARAFNTVFGDVLKMFQDPVFLATVKNITDNIGTAFRNLAPAVAPFVKAFADLASTGSDFLPGLASGLTDMAKSFSKFVADAQANGSLKEFINGALDAFRQLAPLLPELIRQFAGLIPLGRKELPGMVDALRALIRAIDPLAYTLSILGPNFVLFHDTVIGASNVLTWAKGVWHVFWLEVRLLWDMFQNALPSAMTALNAAFSHIPGFGIFKEVMGDIKGLLSDIWDFLKEIASWAEPAWLKWLIDHASNIPGFGGDQPSKGGGFDQGGTVVPKTPGGSGGAPPGSPGYSAPPGSPGWLTNPPHGWDGKPLPQPATPGAAPSPTTPGATPGALPTPSGFNWDAVHAAEAPTWDDHNSGGYAEPVYGGLQFKQATWVGFGGLEFAGRADLATPEEQKAVADRVAFTGYKGTPAQGLGAWESITKGNVPGVTASSTPASNPGSGGTPGYAGAPGSYPGGGGAPGTTTTPVPGEQIGTTAVRDSINAQLNLNVPSGYAKPDGYDEHSGGNAFDVMVGSKSEGDQVAANALQQPGVDYVIWQQATHYPDGRVTPMDDRGSPTKNHMDHVHVHVKSSGYAPGDTPEETGLARGDKAIAYPGSASTAGFGSGGATGGDVYSGLNPNVPADQLGSKDAKGKGQQFGRDFMAGVGEFFGLDGSLFKSPADFAITKILAGIMNVKLKKPGSGGSKNDGGFFGNTDETWPNSGGGMADSGGGGGVVPFFESLLGFGTGDSKGPGDATVPLPAPAPGNPVTGQETGRPPGPGPQYNQWVENQHVVNPSDGLKKQGEDASRHLTNVGQ